MRSKIVAALVGALVLAGLMGAVATSLEPRSSRPNDSLSLVFAAPATDAELSFLSEAGIAAYGKLQVPVDLSAAKKALRLVEEERATSIRGISRSFADEGDADVHVYVDSTGLIVTYIRRGLPAGRVAAIYNVDAPIKLNNLLSDVLDDVTKAMVNKVGPISYWHFGFPGATHVTVAMASGGNCVVQVDAPTQVSLHEISWFVVQSDSRQQVDVSVDGAIVESVAREAYDWASLYLSHYSKHLAVASFGPGKTHVLKISRRDGSCPFVMGVTLVYATG